MAYLPVSAFQRRMTHDQLVLAHQLENAAPRLASVSKWKLLRALVTAKEAFGISARDLALLQALLTFYPREDLEAGSDMILFPSNRTICERMNGLPDSTMRRHLRSLVTAGLLLRRDSNNGKRFAVTHQDSRQAFGFDLTPLLQQAPAIFAAAAEAEEAEARSRDLRLAIQLMRRDLYALLPLLDAETADEAQLFWQDGTRMLRRNLPLALLVSLHEQHEALILRLKTALLNSSDGQNEQHNLNSDINTFESEKAAEKEEPSETESPALPFELVMKACPQIEAFYNAPIRHWSQLTDAAHRLYKAIGISDSGYQNALKHLGAAQTAMVIAALLERFEKIRSPGAYLHRLVQKAALGQFSCRPMVLALLRDPMPT